MGGSGEIWVKNMCDLLCRAFLKTVIVWTITPHLSQSFKHLSLPLLSHVFIRMRRFAYCKVILATSLVWVMLDMFILLYFSECNKCDDKKERGLPGRQGEWILPYILTVINETHSVICLCLMCVFLLQIPSPGRGTGPVKGGSRWWSRRTTRRRWRRCSRSTSSTSWPRRWLLSIGHCLTSAWRGEQPPCS